MNLSPEKGSDAVSGVAMELLLTVSTRQAITDRQVDVAQRPPQL